jgi:hypothetical protein
MGREFVYIFDRDGHKHISQMCYHLVKWHSRFGRRRLLSQTAKVLYFFVALSIMACFAVGSVMLAQERPVPALVLFVVAFVATGIGFAVKGKLMKR